MNRNKINILSIGETCDFIKRFRIQHSQANENYSFIHIDYDGFLHSDIDYNVMLFSLKKSTVDSILSFYKEAEFSIEPPVVIILDDDITENDLLKIPFKNKLAFKSTTTFEEIKYNISIIIRRHELEKILSEFESRVGALSREIETLKGELSYNKINLEELNQTNQHLITATWREREVKKHILEELETIKQENEFNKLNITELSATNEHLISATWRERDLKKQLKEAVETVQASKNLVDKQSKKISESINYSRKIQNVILPDENSIKNTLSESFVLYIPKDVVSGDFPYYYENENLIFLAAVDCTGHGVPGAMLSLMGSLALNEIINNNIEDQSPGTILKSLHYKIVKTLKQDVKGNDASDGMDIALCVMDLEKNILRFAGAHRPLYQIRNNKLQEYKGTRLPIGGKQYRKEISYLEYEIEIQPGDSFFIFSDGYQDQFGGPVNEKYSPSRIQKYLLSNHHLSMDELKEGLNTEFVDWKGNEKQMDDILFMGFKI